VFSYATKNKDQFNRLSPLVSALTKDEYVVKLEQTYEDKLYTAGELESFVDETVSPIPDGVLVTGGASIFKAQSACPFQAFAKYCLNAESLINKQPGLDAAERGELLHKVLQYIWQRLRNSEKLLTMSETELHKLIAKVVNEVLTQYFKRSHKNHDAFMQIERQRLQELTRAWLELEKSRPAFRVVMTEEWQIIIFNDFELRFRLDRVDELEDGKRVIIDYKTGQCSSSQWFGERPEDPQLPLYAITLPEPVAGILLAKIKIGEFELKGLVETEDIFPKDKRFSSIKLPEESWQDTLDEWKTNLNHLAREYKQGHVAVMPRDDNACRYCDLHGLCRISERVTALSNLE